MTLPFAVDPHVWPFTALVMVAMLWYYTRPPEHFVRRLIYHLQEAQIESYRPLLGRHLRRNPKIEAIIDPCLFWLLMLPLLAFTVISLAVHAGIVRNPPSARTVYPEFNPTKFEIVTEGHSIYARPRPATTTTAE